MTQEDLLKIAEQIYLEESPLCKKMNRVMDQRLGDLAQDNPDLVITDIKTDEKTLDSFLDKVIAKKYKEPEQIGQITDHARGRIILRYIDQIPLVAEKVLAMTDIAVPKDGITDYIHFPKNNGYRGYHIVLQKLIDNHLVPFELQIRTMAQHLWASFEHGFRYKNPSAEITEAMHAALKAMAEKLNEVDWMLVALRDQLKPDRVVLDVHKEMSLLAAQAFSDIAIAVSAEKTPKKKRKKKKRH